MAKAARLEQRDQLLESRAAVGGRNMHPYGAQQNEVEGQSNAKGLLKAGGVGQESNGCAGPGGEPVPLPAWRLRVRRPRPHGRAWPAKRRRARGLHRHRG